MGKTCQTCEHRSGTACTALIDETAQRLPSDKGGTTIILNDECVAYLKIRGYGGPQVPVSAYSPIRPLHRL